MRIIFVAVLLFSAVPAQAQTDLNFDIAKLCEWQAANNGMDVGECTKLEEEAKAAQGSLENSTEADRKNECVAEAQNYSGDSGFASHTVFVQCLKNGLGNL